MCLLVYAVVIQKKCSIVKQYAIKQNSAISILLLNGKHGSCSMRMSNVYDIKPNMFRWWTEI